MALEPDPYLIRLAYRLFQSRVEPKEDTKCVHYLPRNTRAPRNGARATSAARIGTLNLRISDQYYLQRIQFVAETVLSKHRDLFLNLILDATDASTIKHLHQKNDLFQTPRNPHLSDCEHDRSSCNAGHFDLYFPSRNHNTFRTSKIQISQKKGEDVKIPHCNLL